MWDFFTRLKAMRFSALIVLITFMVAGCAATVSDISPVSGFRDIAWNTPLESIPNLTIIPRGNGRWKWATREPEKLKFGDVDVDNLEYIFVDDAFAGVNIQFSGYENLSRLIGQLESVFGPPTIKNKKMKMLAWKTEGTTIMLRYYRIQNIGRLKYILDRVTND
ncbi:hypothetical protein DSCO28_64020 [Desulfosarcina ovata subsp. sediminis]|uniref:Lipoprotein n=1 Tax=Desulfosarcina ovata subsp. sediminis TaxID=885957 RepID=A0A5K8A090_9BACT|nr:hypothetical protein [Desulfosarcina ovata]BBO85836.1 hypothetical protein DSCO28_64020 [Desulfosarcina ovata subsp. sediminis]